MPLVAVQRQRVLFRQALLADATRHWRLGCLFGSPRNLELIVLVLHAAVNSFQKRVLHEQHPKQGPFQDTKNSLLSGALQKGHLCEHAAQNTVPDTYFVVSELVSSYIPLFTRGLSGGPIKK